MKQIVAVWLVVLCGLWSASAAAQGGVVYTPTKAQIRLLQRAAVAVQNGETKQARDFYRQALELGPFNVAHLSLGRLMQKDGDCQGALEQFEAARKAPVVAAPPADQVIFKLDAFTQELRQECPGELKVTCAESRTVLTLNGEPIKCEAWVSRPPGRYTIEGTIEDSGEEVSKEIVLLALERREVSMDIEAPPPVDPLEAATRGGNEVGVETMREALGVVSRMPKPPVVVLPEPGLTSRDVWGWSLVGGGALALGAGGVFTALVAQTNAESRSLADQNNIERSRAEALIEESERWAALQFVGYGIGGTLVATGILLFVFDGEESAAPEGDVAVEPSAAGPSLQIWTDPNAAGATLHWAF